MIHRYFPKPESMNFMNYVRYASYPNPTTFKNKKHNQKNSYCMKTQFYLTLLTTVILAMTACSNENDPNKTDNRSTTGGEKYMAIRIQTAGMDGTRAFSPNNSDFEEGSDNEGSVELGTTRFFFFDASGNAFTMSDANNVHGEVTSGSNMVKPTNLKATSSDGSDTGTDGILILGEGTGQGYQGFMPYQAVCVVAASTNESDINFVESLENKTLSELATALAEGDNNLFVMSNSNWSGTNAHGAVTIGDKIQDSVDKAQQNPAHFYLERLAVRVEITPESFKGYIPTDGESNEITYKIYDSDNNFTETKLRIKLANWQLVKKIDKAHVIKQLPTADPFTLWNDPTRHRCYWAVTDGINPPDAERSFDIYSDDNWLAQNSKAYSYEWTNGGAISLLDRTSTTTSVAIRGYVQKSDTPDNEDSWKNIDLIKWGSSYYTYDEFQKLVIETYNKTHTTILTSEHVQIVKDADNGNYYKAIVDGNDYTLFKNISRWEDGVTSFYMNIQHATDSDENPLFGVVRNHIYRYSITGVKGLGIPGNGPGDNESETFVAARLYVLNWNVISHNITLE